MELSTDNYRKQRDFHILLSSAVLILGVYAFQDFLFTPNLSSTKDAEVFQLDTANNLPTTTNDNVVEYNGVVAYNQNTNTYILQTTNGNEYIITSKFANFLELVGEKVTVGGVLTGNTIKVNKVQIN